jgi:hypothetical protein
MGCGDASKDDIALDTEGCLAVGRGYLTVQHGTAFSLYSHCRWLEEGGLEEGV